MCFLQSRTIFKLKCVGATANPPKSDDWKWATDKSCIHNKWLLKKSTFNNNFLQSKFSFWRTRDKKDPFFSPKNSQKSLLHGSNLTKTKVPKTHQNYKDKKLYQRLCWIIFLSIFLIEKCKNLCLYKPMCSLLNNRQNKVVCLSLWPSQISDTL